MRENDNQELILNINNGPIARQLLRIKIGEEFDQGRVENAVFYQVCSLYGMLQDRYFNKHVDSTTLLDSKIPAHNNPKDEKNENELLCYVRNALENNFSVKDEKNDAEFLNSCNFLLNINDPVKGFEKITEICNTFPKEWTVVQVCKAPRPQTSYSLYREIHERESDIYVTVLKHARSAEYSEPVCIRLSDFLQVELFELFSKISDSFKEYMQVNADEFFTRESKVKYWESLKLLDTLTREVLIKLRAYIFPWLFIFRGLPRPNTKTGSSKYQKEAFADVDNLCKDFNLNQRECILLSLASLQVPYLSLVEIEAISEELSTRKTAQKAIQKLLKDLQKNVCQSDKIVKTENSDGIFKNNSHYPCILIVDEQLDHFYWEELNVWQEMSRVNSLQCLYKLYETHKHKIRSGYLQVNVKKGACSIDPDGTLPKTQTRMSAFFKYYTPSWHLKVAAKLTKSELFDEFLKQDCYVYAGHGSGFLPKSMDQKTIDAVVFLFGCDSTRINSNGLFSDLIGAHFYYHAALCPCVVGAMLPALDSQMDAISVEILSRWLTPESDNIARWDQINRKLWTKQGDIEPLSNGSAKTNVEMKKSNEYQNASLCAILSLVHARTDGGFYYNTVPYVCRGLPAWNCGLQTLPEHD